MIPPIPENWTVSALYDPDSPGIFYDPTGEILQGGSGDDEVKGGDEKLTLDQWLDKTRAVGIPADSDNVERGTDGIYHWWHLFLGDDRTIAGVGMSVVVITDNLKVRTKCKSVDFIQVKTVTLEVYGRGVKADTIYPPKTSIDNPTSPSDPTYSGCADIVDPNKAGKPTVGKAFGDKPQQISSLHEDDKLIVYHGDFQLWVVCPGENQVLGYYSYEVTTEEGRDSTGADLGPIPTSSVDGHKDWGNSKPQWHSTVEATSEDNKVRERFNKAFKNYIDLTNPYGSDWKK